MTLSRERLTQAEELLFRIGAQTEAQRRATLSSLRERDAPLAAEVESLLAHAERLGDFLEQPALGASFTLLPAQPSAALERGEPDELLGSTIGRYRLERRLGSGGMGTVYLAARADAQFTQRVALKLVKRGMDTDEILQRFRRERQTLAALEHPGIARLIDGGASERGQPYLVMEYVEGEPIDAYCDRSRLDVDARLELFLRVCEAVRHAHQQLVVHRDLKPGNILVTAEGVPKLVDFGIATVQGGASGSRTTGEGERRLTPEYASPEQVAGAAVTTTSDVYSLGVVLCELLSGAPPFRFEARTAAEVRSVVATREPVPPSELVRRGAPALRNRAAEARRATPLQLVRKLRGDLDTIVLAALRKDPLRRYASVEQLAADLRRHLDRQPVAARRDTFAYRASRFVLRHTLATALSALSILLLVAGSAATAWQARVAGQQRDRAVAERARAEATTAFLQLMLESADPEHAGPGMTVRQVLDEAARRLDGPLSDGPLVQAGLRSTIGRTYGSLGIYPEAEVQLRTALRLRRELSGPRDRSVAEAMEDLAKVLYAVQELDEAAELLEGALAIHAGHADAGAGVARALASLGAVKRAQGNLDRAEALQRQALELRRRAGKDTLDEAESLNNLAGVLGARGELDAAQPLLEEALRIRRARLGLRQPLVAQSTDNLAVLLHRKGELAAAEPLYRQALELETCLLGPEHPDVAITRRNLALLLLAKGARGEAEEQLCQCLAARRKSLPAADSRTLATLLDLADLLARTQRAPEAVKLVDEALDATRELPTEAQERRVVLARGAELLERCGARERAAELRAALAPAR